jgi:hypothetical protein
MALLGRVESRRAMKTGNVKRFFDNYWRRLGDEVVDGLDFVFVKHHNELKARYFKN